MKKSELREIIRKELGILNEDQSSDFVKMKDELAKLLGKDNYKIINRNRYTLIISRSSKSQPGDQKTIDKIEDIVYGKYFKDGKYKHQDIFISSEIEENKNMKKSELRKIIKEELLKEEKFRAIDYNKIEKFDDFVSWPLKEAKKYGGLRDIKMDANIGNLIMGLNIASSAGQRINKK